MTVIQIIRQSESEHCAPCGVGEVRFARLNEREANECERRLIYGKGMRGWNAVVVRDNAGKKAHLRYTRRG